MDDWKQSVEGRLGRLEGKLDDHLKWVLIAFATGFVLLAGLILNRTDAVGDDIRALTAQVSLLQTDVAVLKSAPTAAPTKP